MAVTKTVSVLEKCKTDRLLIKPGRNVWIIARTDRDAPTPETVIQTTGAFLLRALGRVSPSGFNITEVIQDPAPPQGALAAWYIGAARPALVSRISRSMPLDVAYGGRLGRSIECDYVRLIQATQTWYVVVEFDWRGPLTWAPWPASHVSALGFRSQDTRRTDLDWLVLEAWHRGEAQEPDSTLGAEIGDYVGDVAEDVGRKARELATFGAKGALVAVAIAVTVLLAIGFARTSRTTVHD